MSNVKSSYFIESMLRVCKRGSGRGDRKKEGRWKRRTFRREERDVEEEEFEERGWR